MENAEPAAGKAVKWTEAADGAVWLEQPIPQLMPAGLEGIVPVADPIY